MKKLLLVTVLLSTVSWASDPVVEQANITRDAVQTLVEEFSQGSINLPHSADAEEKVKHFTTAAEKALKKFEASVRIRILQSFQPLVSQYNKMHASTALGESRHTLLENLRNQMNQIVRDKNVVYRDAYFELFSVLPDLPVYLDYDGEDKDRIKGVSFGGYVGTTFDTTIYSSRSRSQNVALPKPNHEWVYRDYFPRLIGSPAFPSAKEIKLRLLEGCYSSSCFYAIQAQYTLWKSMVESTLGRNMVIKLNDGNTITITKNVSRRSAGLPILEQFITTPTEGLINELPNTISAERLAILRSLEKEIPEGGRWCRNIKPIKERLCQETQEGCLAPSEIELIKFRYPETYCF